MAKARADEIFQPDLYDYDFENAPLEVLNRLRTEDPVHWSRHGFWFLTRYADNVAVLQDPVRFPARQPAGARRTRWQKRVLTRATVQTRR